MAFLFSRSVTISPTSSLTLKVYQQIYQNYPKSELIKTTVTTFQEGYQAASELVSQGSDIECIFTNGDDVAAGVRQYYLDNGLSVPMLIGQENQLSGFLLNLPTIDHHLEQLGKLAFDLAISPKIKQLTVTSEFITR